jgi:hypothetical protein
MARRGAIDRLEEPVRAAVDKLIREGHTTVAIGEHLTNWPAWLWWSSSYERVWPKLPPCCGGCEA